MNVREARIPDSSNFKRPHGDGVDPQHTGAHPHSTSSSFSTTQNRRNSSNRSPRYLALSDEQDPRNITMLRAWFRRKETNPESSISGPQSPLAEAPPSSNTTPPQIISSVASSPTIPSANVTPTATTPAATTTTTTTAVTQSKSPTLALPKINKAEENNQLKLELRTSKIKYIQANRERMRLKSIIEALEHELASVYSTIEEQVGDPGHNLEKLRSMEGEIKALCKAYLRVEREKEELNKENGALKGEVEELTRTLELEATARELNDMGDRLAKYQEQDGQIRYMAALIERQSAELARLNKYQN